MHATQIVTDDGLAALLQASTQARRQALELIDLAARGASSDAAAQDRSPSLAEIAAEIVREQKLLVANIAQLRTLHRSAYFSARETKSQTAEARQEVDRLHLQLQNLYYEQQHLQGEISACQNYDHSYEHLPLISEEEFLALHPEHADADEVALMTARITHEKQEREALEKQKNELLKKKLKLIAENKKRKEDLASLDRDLENFIDAAKPIQNLFDKVV
ncbi:putative thoc5 family protein [Ophiostoma piceae UAMH 11346]|uniref:Putative thoc5 family protein n=1 Tax=Ophiostoma piceae (strain UAMH 11346) TaxID=1262450 RepID=S3C460_OPHP1|nr:putative thoc5 family protein [Ophiostoma piceae UAMH 11346]